MLGGGSAVSGAAVTAWRNNRYQAEERQRDRDHERRLRSDDREHDRAQRRLDMEHDLSLRRAEFENRRTAKLRDNMIVVAGDLSEALGWISSRSVFIRYEDLESALGEMEKKLSQAQSTLGRVSLFFGPQSEAAVSARSAYFFVGQLVARVRQLADVRPAVDRATHGLNQVITDARDKEAFPAIHKFEAAAGRAVREDSPPPADDDRLDGQWPRPAEEPGPLW